MKMEFIINNTKLKLDDNNNLYYWFDTTGNTKLKNPYWRLKKISTNKGYQECSINKKNYKFHRIVYYAHNQDWNIYENIRNNSIDHKDRDKSNNNISNLRVVNQSINMFNIERVDNAKGCSIRQSGRFEVHFRKKYYGTYDTKEEAHQKYLEVKNEYLNKNNIII